MAKIAGKFDPHDMGIEPGNAQNLLPCAIGRSVVHEKNFVLNSEALANAGEPTAEFLNIVFVPVARGKDGQAKRGVLHSHSCFYI